MAEVLELSTTATLGQRVRRLRTALGLSQAQLGLRIDLSQPRISQIEKGTPDAPLPLRTLRDLATALNVTFAELIAGDPLYDLFDLDEDAQSPPLRSNLPFAVVPFVGRTADLEVIGAILRQGDCRLLTLIGPAGVGKTQLALHVVAGLGNAGAEFFGVSLAACVDMQGVLQATAQAIGVQDRDPRPLLERVREALGRRPALLLWDNAEHVRSAVAALASDLASACPALVMLVTSRAPLDMQIESVFQVLPLPLPQHGVAATVATASASPAVQLFVHRASRALPGFVLWERNAATISEICRRLDGLPLALELAATKLRVMALEQVLETLDRRLELLISESSDIPPRQRSLRASIAWSYELLDEKDQTLFRALAVFVNGFTLEAARDILPHGGSDELVTPEYLDWSASEVANGVARLLDQQLLTRTEQPDGIPRFSMLESIHVFAREQLAAAAELTSVQNRQLAWCLKFAEQAISRVFTVDEGEWIARLRQEDANLQAALKWGLGSGRTDAIEAGMLLAGILADYWFVTGMLSEGRSWLERAVTKAAADAPTPGLARCLVGACLLAQTQAAVANAELRCERGLAVAQQLADRTIAARATLLLGNLAMMRGDLPQARSFHEEALAEFRALGDLPWTAVALINLGMDAYRLGDAAQAIACANEALAFSRVSGSRWDTTAALRLLGDVARDRGEFSLATAYFSESLSLGWTHGNERDAADTLSGLGTVYVMTGDLQQAARVLGASEALYRRFQIAFPPPMRPEWHQVVAAIRHGLGDSVADLAWEMQTPEQVVREAIMPS